MDLLLLRCAETVKSNGADSVDALQAGLSERGLKQSRRLAGWLHQQELPKLRVFSSPARAARDMASLVGNAAVVSRRLGPQAQASDLLAAVGWPHDHRAALIIAHQPALGALAALLLSGQEAPWTIKKGSLWWFSNRTRANESQTVLRCVVTAEILKHPGGQGVDAGVESATGNPLAPNLAKRIVMRGLLLDRAY